MKLRRVKFKHPNESTKGYFHTWGVKQVPQENGTDFAVTVAIVELENGQIEFIDPCNIIFI